MCRHRRKNNNFQSRSVNDGNDGACAMIERGSIPAVTVMGYNRNVSWSKLMARLKRVIQNNVQTVVK